MKTFKVCLLTLLIGISSAALCIIDQWLNYEEKIGLPLLFTLRGPSPPPEQVIIVSIDKVSAEILHLSDDPEKWPRSYYAQLIKKLNQQSPAIIGFNLHFGKTRDTEDDATLASAMAEHRNIILSNYLKQYSQPAHGREQSLLYVHMIDPVPILAKAALGAAPFPLPKTASSVNKFWTYSAGDMATLPATVFQCYLFKQTYPEILQLLQEFDPVLKAQLPESFDKLTEESKVFEILQKIRNELTRNSQSLERLGQLTISAHFNPEKTSLLQSWLALLKGGDNLYFNHYGKTGSITTVPFYQAIVMEILNPELFKNKIVLVGYSENIEPEKNQCLYTVFSYSDNLCISPIELAATAVANLVDNSWIKPIAQTSQFFLVLGWGLLLTAICWLFSNKKALILIALLSAAYVMYACFEFSLYYLWVPLFIPIFIQTPLAFLFAYLLYFLKRRKENQLDFGELMHGVCMATDAGQYTTLSENMNPNQLNVLMNRYYDTLFLQVKKHNGKVTDVIGDAMLAVWAKPVPDIQSRMDACRSALVIKTEVDRFNQSQLYQLPTRLGLHYGEMRLGNVGSKGHLEYRAIGDTVNTATRIEGLNKLLGTQILVSASVIENLPGVSTREMGIFLLKGKTQPIKIFELLEPLAPNWLQLVKEFTEALLLFQSHQWPKALEKFIEISAHYPDDAPTRFYIRYLQSQTPKPDNPETPAIIELT